MDFFETYAPAIRILPEQVGREDIMNGRFQLEKTDGLNMYYAPHNEWVNDKAKIVIVGITPGWTQTKLAFEAAGAALRAGASGKKACIEAKRAARFAGAMRRNLISMLDALGLAETFQIDSAEALFHSSEDLLHTTSLIKYPVFKQGRNYTGHSPKIGNSPMLSKYVYEQFPKELAQTKAPMLLIPLGNAVGEVLKELEQDGKIHASHCLYGFPHPSGANGHRLKQFAAEKERLAGIIHTYAKAELK